MPTDIIKGVTDVFTKAATDNMTVAEARWALIGTNVLTAFLTSKYTRKRVADGAEPILGFF